MFGIGSQAIDKRGRIFKIVAQEDKDFGSGLLPYFVLTPCFAYDFTPGYQCYIPVDKAESLLRPLLTKEEAMALLSQVPSLTPLSTIGPHERKTQFQNIISSGNRLDILRVIRTLLAYREERRKLNKPFSDFDTRLLKNLTSLLCDEMSIVFDIPAEEVPSFVEKICGMYLFI